MSQPVPVFYPTAAGGGMMEQPSNADLATLTALWQRRLELQDWQVTCQGFARVTAIEDRYHASTIRYVIKTREAIISLRDPIDRPADIWTPDDYEVFIVHELLHLHFAPLNIDDDAPEDVAQEQAINALARALVRLKREGDSHAEDAAQSEADPAEPGEGTPLGESHLREREGQPEGRGPGEDVAALGDAQEQAREVGPA
jgi:hypothetical protein